ncbi:MAG: hypothetical protein ABFC63_07975 [Thermoguttaceae bacterium]
MRTNLAMLAAMFAALSLFVGLSQAAQPADPVKLTAESYDSGFQWAHDTYNGMGRASDGRIYYVLCSEKHDVAGQMFRFDPATKKIAHVGDLTEACGEKQMKAVAQGKIHNNFVEANGKLYFSTHTGYYVILNDMEVIGPPPNGWKAYQGGHFLAYDLATGRFEDFGIPCPGEGIIAMNMDASRGRLYGLTWPHGRFVTYDLASKQSKDFGPMAREGEAGRGDQYRTICRSLAVDSTDGAVYFTTGDGVILRYDYARQTVATVQGDNLKKDYFGLYDPSSPGHMGYNWRQTTWCPAERAFYGVHGNSGYLFRFDPRGPQVTVLDRLTSLPSKRTGMFDQFSYGYLGFTLGPDGRTLYYLTGAPIYVHGKRLAGKDSTGKGEAKGLEDLHLVTYDIPTSKYTDHGAIFLSNGQRPLYVNSIAVGKDGSIYSLCRITTDGRTRADLIRIPAESIKLSR